MWNRKSLKKRVRELEAALSDCQQAHVDSIMSEWRIKCELEKALNELETWLDSHHNPKKCKIGGIDFTHTRE